MSNMLLAAILKGMEAGVAALMLDLIVDMCAMILKERSLFLSALIPLSFAANLVLGVNVALILAVCCCVCVLRVLYRKRKGE